MRTYVCHAWIAVPADRPDYRRRSRDQFVAPGATWCLAAVNGTAASVLGGRAFFPCHAVCLGVSNGRGLENRHMRRYARFPMRRGALRRADTGYSRDCGQTPYNLRRTLPVTEQRMCRVV